MNAHTKSVLAAAVKKLPGFVDRKAIEAAVGEIIDAVLQEAKAIPLQGGGVSHDHHPEKDDQ